MIYSQEFTLGVKVVDALHMFCHVIDPIGQTFHPPLFLEEVHSKKYRKANYSLQFFPEMEVLVSKSYERALQRHEAENPGGPRPNKIQMQGGRSGMYELRWVSKDATVVSIRVERKIRSRHCPLIRLSVRGKDIARVQERLGRFLELVWLQ